MTPGIGPLINDLFDAVFAIPTESIDPDTGRVSAVDPIEVKDDALAAVIVARAALLHAVRP